MSKALQDVREWFRRVVRDVLDRVRTRGRSAAIRALRLTGAAVASYVVAHLLFPDTQPLLAPLTALLVVQLTLSSTVTNGLQRMVSVVAGVVLAVFFSSVVGLTWWSLAILIAASIVVGQLLRLGPHLLEVPISAMLVLGVGSAESAAWGRIIETLIGAVVGVLVNLLFPPSVKTQQAGAAVEQYATEMADLLDRAGDGLAAGVSVDRAAQWLEDARRLNRHTPRLDRTLVHAEESRRLNLRALGTPKPGPTLRSGLDVLEHSSVAIRSLFRSILDGLQSWPEEENGPAGEVRQAFAVLLHDLAEAVRSFGRLVCAETELPGEPAEEAQLAAALEALREARARVSELLLVDPRDDPTLWELNSALLATVQRILHELDVEERVRLRERRREEAAGRPRTVQAVDRLRTSTRQMVDRERPPPRRARRRRRRAAAADPQDPPAS